MRAERLPGDRGRPAAACAVALLLAALAVTGAGAAGEVDRADRAFEAGEHEAALSLYDEVLRNDPRNLHALVRSGMLLSWSRRFDESIARYDRALDVEPGHRRAALERAKVLSWSRRFDEAATSFRALLREDGDDPDLLLGLARTLSWSGRQTAAREQYRAVLAGDAGNAEAMVGVGQTYAWSGDPKRARQWYEAALARRPAMKEAVLGLAYLDLSAGETGEAFSRTRDLEDRFPGDPDVQELGRAVRRARAPWVQLAADAVSDTDDNDLDIWRLEAGWLPFGRTELRFGAARYEMEAPGREASVDSLYAVLGWRPRPGHLLTLRAGNDRRERTGGATDDETIGGVAYLRTFAAGAWNLRLSAQSDTFRYSTDILDGPGNTIEVYEARAEGRPVARWRVHAAVGAWEISDGNGRASLEAGAARGFTLGRTTLEAGYRFRFIEYDRDLDNGYFDPTDFRSHLAELRASGRFGSSRGYWRLGVETGLQSFTLGGVEVSDDSVLGGSATVGFPLAGGVNLELYGNRTDYAAQSGTGFESRQLGVRLRWQGGPR